MRCRVCDHSDGNARHSAVEMMFGTRDPFDYVECARCGCVQIERVPADLSPYYPPDYYSFAAPQAPSRGPAAWLRRRRDRFAVTGRGLAGRLAYALKPVPVLLSLRATHPALAARILDVGSGHGDLADALFRAGFRGVVGIDPFVDRDRASAHGAPVLRRRLDQVDGGWDLIMFHHSFEHVPDPLATLRAAAERLAPGGICLIRMPVADSFAWRHFGVHWAQLDPPRHLHVHTRASVAILAAAAGLTLERVIHDSTGFQFWASEQYRRGIPLRSPGSWLVDPARSPFSPADIRDFERRAAELNARGEGDQAAFHLRRAGDA